MKDNKCGENHDQKEQSVHGTALQGISATTEPDPSRQIARSDNSDP